MPHAGDGATSIVEMLFCTSLVALVGAGDRPASSTRRLQIVNTKVGHVHCDTDQKVGADAHHGQRQSTICELTFPTTILAVKLNRRRLVVVLEERIYVYDISNMKLLHEIETSPNPNGEPKTPGPEKPPPKTNTRPDSHLRPRALVGQQLPRVPFTAALAGDALFDRSVESNGAIGRRAAV